MAFSVKGNSVTMLLDCETQETLPLERNESSLISNAGIMLVGQDLLDEKHFQVGRKDSCGRGRWRQGFDPNVFSLLRGRCSSYTSFLGRERRTSSARSTVRRVTCR